MQKKHWCGFKGLTDFCYGADVVSYIKIVIQLNPIVFLDTVTLCKY